MNWGQVVEAVFEDKIEPSLIQPCHIIDYPREISPLAKVHRDNDRLTERFETRINGWELANAFSELTDPIDQRSRFEAQALAKANGDEEAMELDEDFITSLEYGMPPTGGMGMGIDRLTMFMTGQTTIQDVLFFPQMRPEKAVQKDDEAKFGAVGVPAEWVPVLHKMSLMTVEAMRKIAPGKLFNDLCGFNKKNKLGLKNPTLDEVRSWMNESEK